MLITCPDCGKNISDQALACPDCDRPIHVLPTLDKDETAKPIQTIELTSKKYKSQLVAAFILLFLFSCSSILFLLELEKSLTPGRIKFLYTQENIYLFLLIHCVVFSFFGAISSLIWIAITRFLVWWHHR